MEHAQRAIRLIIWTLLILSPMPREWAQPTADLLMDMWSGIAHHPAPRSTTHAG